MIGKVLWGLCIVAFTLAFLPPIGPSLGPEAVLGQSAKPSGNPLTGDTGAISKGKSLFRSVCVECHGVKANGVSMRGRVKDLRKIKLGYSLFLKTVKEGRVSRRYKVDMPPWGNVFTEEEINQIGAYLETLALPEAIWIDPE